MKRAALLLSSLLASSLAHGQVAPPVAVTVPTLDEGGLFVMIALVGVVGGFIARRLNK
jgi:hypothetical protein